MIHTRNAVLIFIILHLLVYPASNGYNSYMDRDESPIGGLAKPLQPTRQLFLVTVIMDTLAVLISLLVSGLFALGILLYILASRAYSYRGIRLKRYPVLGFLTVFICQGALIFILVYHGAGINTLAGGFPGLGKTLSSGTAVTVSEIHAAMTGTSLLNQTVMNVPLLPALTASLLIGALYPLTQVYQHEADRRDGINTISYLLGKRGSFVFSALLFLAATLCLYLRFYQQDALSLFYRFLLIMFPVVLFFLYWTVKVWQNGEAADFNHSLKMNIVSTLCTTVFFITLIISLH